MARLRRSSRFKKIKTFRSSYRRSHMNRHMSWVRKHRKIADNKGI